MSCGGRLPRARPPQRRPCLHFSASPPPPPSRLPPSRSIGRSDGGAYLAYAEWVELLGLIAHSLGDAKLLGLRRNLTTTAGGAPLPMLAKLELLFSAMADAGAHFEGEAHRLLRPVRDSLRRRFAAAQEAAGAAAGAAAVGERRRVQGVLAETVWA